MGVTGHRGDHHPTANSPAKMCVPKHQRNGSSCSPAYGLFGFRRLAIRIGEDADER